MLSETANVDLLFGGPKLPSSSSSDSSSSSSSVSWRTLTGHTPTRTPARKAPSTSHHTQPSQATHPLPSPRPPTLTLYAPIPSVTASCVTPGPHSPVHPEMVRYRHDRSSNLCHRMLRLLWLLTDLRNPLE